MHETAYDKTLAATEDPSQPEGQPTVFLASTSHGVNLFSSAPPHASNEDPQQRAPTALVVVPTDASSALLTDLYLSKI